MNLDEQEYYARFDDNDNDGSQSLCARFGMEVVHAGDARGKIVRATRPVSAGDVVWVETALVGMAHLSSARLAAGCACARCMRPLRSLQDAWARTGAVLAEDARAAHKRKMKKLQAKSKGKKKAAASAEEEASKEEQEQPELSLPEVLPFLSQDASAPSSADASAGSFLHLPACEPVACSRQCGEVYCSVACRDQAFAHSHELLCAGGSAETSAAHASLLKHATSNNEIFMLAAQAVVHASLQALRLMRVLPGTQQLLDVDDSSASSSSSAGDVQPLLPFAARFLERLSALPASEAASLRAQLASATASALRPFERFCGATWWEHVSVPDSVRADAHEEAEYREKLCGVVEQSLARMVALAEAQFQVAASSAASPAGSWDEVVSSLCLDDIWSLSFLGRILSSFERNNIGHHAPTALGLYVAHIRSLDEARRSTAVEQMGEEVWNVMQTRADGPAASAAAGGAASSEEPVPPLSTIECTGLFVVGCCMNHSCDPNITLRPKVPEEGSDGGNDKDGAVVVPPSAMLDRSAVFVALRDIAAGEELNISYIDLLHPAAAAAGEGNGDDDAPPTQRKEEVGVDERRAQLQAYDFLCACNKCVRQSAAGASSSSSSAL